MDLQKMVDVQTAYTQQKKELSQGVKDALRNWLKDHPEFDSIRWTQYTPYFNDGDPCYFSVHDVRVRPIVQMDDVERNDYDGDYGDKYLSHYYFKKDSPAYKTVKELDTMIRQLKGFVEEAFGDGVEVTAYVDRVEVADYDHD